jgi:hypothetical protein
MAVSRRRPRRSASSSAHSATWRPSVSCVDVEYTQQIEQTNPWRALLCRSRSTSVANWTPLQIAQAIKSGGGLIEIRPIFYPNSRLLNKAFDQLSSDHQLLDIPFAVSRKKALYHFCTLLLPYLLARAHWWVSPCAFCGGCVASVHSRSVLPCSCIRRRRSRRRARARSSPMRHS